MLAVLLPIRISQVFVEMLKDNLYMFSTQSDPRNFVDATDCLANDLSACCHHCIVKAPTFVSFPCSSRRCSGSVTSYRISAMQEPPICWYSTFTMALPCLLKLQG